jgi:hypothetical protein
MSKPRFHARVTSDNGHHINALLVLDTMEQAKAFTRDNLLPILPEWNRVVIDDMKNNDNFKHSK